MEEAAFRLKDYFFDKLLLNAGNLDKKSVLALSFTPHGVFDKKNNSYMLSFLFTASTGRGHRKVVSVSCNAVFVFVKAIEFSDIPSFFYPNSIAIIYPYIRAMVSTLTLQANMKKPIILPTLNLTSLGNELKENTTLLVE